MGTKLTIPLLTTKNLINDLSGKIAITHCRQVQQIPFFKVCFVIFVLLFCEGVVPNERVG
jgi:hypothetical protein